MERITTLREKIRVDVQTIATAAVLVALALVLSLIEQSIPLSFSVPGIRLGLANVATVFALYLLGPLPALVVLVLRCILGAVFAGTFTAFLFSLTGGLLAFLIMWLLSKSRHISPIGACVGGAGAHNIGQILIACLVLGSKAPLAYLPVLLLVSVVTGLITGLVATLVLGGLNGGYYIADKVQSKRGFRPDPEMFEPTAPIPVPEPQPAPVSAPVAVEPVDPTEAPPDAELDDFINSEVWDFVNAEYEEKPLPTPEEIPLPQGETYDDIMARIRTAEPSTEAPAAETALPKVRPYHAAEADAPLPQTDGAALEAQVDRLMAELEASAPKPEDEI